MAVASAACSGSEGAPGSAPPPDPGAADGSTPADADAGGRDGATETEGGPPDSGKDVSTPPAPPAPRAVAVGTDNSCALLSNGTVKCWGRKYWGMLGNASATADSATPLLVDGIADATALSASTYHACVIVSGGAVKCWGSYFANGGILLAPLAPVLIAGVTGATALADAEEHSCALVAGGQLRCWGANEAGQLGDGTTNPSKIAKVALVPSASAVATTGASACAIVAGGAVKCWGDNQAASLGDGTLESSVTAKNVIGISGATALFAGNSSFCALGAGSALTCWGASFRGDGIAPKSIAGLSGLSSLVPVELGMWTVQGGRVLYLPSGSAVAEDAGLSGVTAAGFGAGHRCVVAGGKVQCWGNNSSGQLGPAAPDFSEVPVVVTGL